MTLEEQLKVLSEKLDKVIEERENENSLKERKKMDENGRVTIPKSIRKVLGWNESVEVEIEIYGKNILIKRVDKQESL